MSKTVVCDIEADGLLPTVTKIHCIVCKDWDTGEITSFTPDNLDEFETFADTVDHWIGHNFINYDARVIRKILGVRIRPTRVTDTLIKSRLQQYSREHGHSLDGWGRKLNFPKLPFKDFSEYTPEMLEYCINDVELTYKVAVYLKSEGVKVGSAAAERLENMVEYLLSEQTENGFALDVPKANDLYTMFKNRANRLEMEILDEVPPRPKLLREIEPKYTKDGALSKVGLKFYGDDYGCVRGPFSRIEFEDFNLDSPKQKVIRLNPYWSPTVRTKGYRKLKDKLRDNEITQEEFDKRQATMWQLCEENFATIRDDAPQSLRKLGEYAMYTARYKEVGGWLDALGPDDRVHGQVFSIGAVTHRMSHNNPNMANIPGVSSPFGKECRSCFTVSDPDNYVLVGCDASGIQLRVLAHYMNDPDYTEEVVNGDIHTKNQEAGGFESRDIAKTFIYAFLLGAGDEKIGLITGGDSKDGRRYKEQFLKNTPALADLRKEAASTARVGRLVGLDGRHIEVKSTHYALSCYLQGAEAVVMKHAMVLWNQRAKKLKLDARQVAVVHDEFQVEVRKDQADELGNIIVQSIIDAGSHYKMNCPMDGEYKIGTNWLETH